MAARQRVLVIGGTGAQGVQVVKALAKGDSYSVVVVTRTPSSDDAQELARLPNVTLFQVHSDTFDEEELHRAFSAADLAFINTNGWIGEKEEVFWGTRMYEIARIHRLKHFVWSAIPYASKLSNYDPKYRSPIMDSKGKVADFLTAQDRQPMAWSILTSCPYMDALSETVWRPIHDRSTDIYTFVAPIGQGAPPMIDLEDLGRYARWLFDHPDESNGMHLKVATENCSLAHMAATFSKVTGKKAISRPMPLDEFFEFLSSKGMKMDAQFGDSTDRYTNKDWMTGFMNLWSASWRDRGLARVDYELLDRILPDRKRTLEEWMRKSGYDGKFKKVLRMQFSGTEKEKKNAAARKSHL